MKKAPTLHTRFALAHLAGAFTVGVLVGNWFSFPLPLLVVAGLLASILIGAVTLTRAGKLAPALLAQAFLMAGIAIGALAGTDVRGDRSLRRLIDTGSIAPSKPVVVEGVLARDPETAHGRRYLDLEVNRIRFEGGEQDVDGRVSLVVVNSPEQLNTFDRLDLRYGARLHVSTSLDRADKFRNPGGALFSEFLDRRGYDAAGLVKRPEQIERLDDATVVLPLAWVYQLRTALQSRIDANFSSETAGVLDAALLGNRHNLTRSSAERFRVGGTFHVLVISGMHITFLGGLVFVAVRRFTRNRIFQFVASSTVVWAYSLAVGADQSVLRAALMFTFVLLGPLLSRRALSLNALGGVAFVLLVWRPQSILDPSFQLTFASVLAIVVFAWPLLERMSRIGRWRPTQESPYPPSCSPWLRSFCECLFWSEQKSQDELRLGTHSYHLFKAPLAGKFERLHIQAPLRYIFQALVVSAAVQLILLPFLIVYFHRLSPAAFLLNIVVSALMVAVSLGAGVALLVQQVSTILAGPLFSITEGLNWLMVHSVDPIEISGMASLRLPEYSGPMSAIYVLYFLPLSLVAILLFRWDPFRLNYHSSRDWGIARIALAVQAIAVAILVFHPASERVTPGTLTVDFLDVGQGDAALITLPEGTTILVDGGGEPGPFQKLTIAYSGESFEPERRRVGEAVVSEYLWWRGLDHVDYLLASHADADHIDGLADVAGNFSVRAALVARMPAKDAEYSTFSKTLLARNIPVSVIGAGDELRLDGVSIDVLWPAPSDNSDLTSANNDSLVLRIKYGTRSILMTGDIESRAESFLVNSKAELSADVVKVPHHGSKTSSSASFIAATDARLAIISVGRKSIFGHPHAEVLDRWKGSGAEVLTTGSSGMITLITNGTDLRVDRWQR